MSKKANSEIEKMLDKATAIIDKDLDFDDMMSELNEFLEDKISSLPTIPQELYNEFENYSNIFYNIQQEYKDKFNTLNKECEEKASYVEYAQASGSSNIKHRGYYGVSLEELIIGNIKKGKLIKNLTSRTKNYYKYYFSNDGTLLKIECYYEGKLSEIEFIIKKSANIRIGVNFDNSDKTICYITYEIYDRNNLLTDYVEGYNPESYNEKDFWFDYCEKRFYDKFKKIEKIRYVFGPLNNKLLSENYYDVAYENDEIKIIFE